MRGSIWTIGALGIMAAFLPAMLDIDVGGDETGETAVSLLSSVDVLVVLAFVIACFGLLTLFFTSDGF